MPFSEASRFLLASAAASRLARATTVADFGNIIVAPKPPLVPFPFPFPQPLPKPPPIKTPPPEPPVPSPIGSSLIKALKDVRAGDLITSELMNRLGEVLEEVGGRLAEVEAGKNALISVLHETDARLDALEARSAQPPAPPTTHPPLTLDPGLMRDLVRVAERLQPVQPDPANPGQPPAFDPAVLHELATLAPRLQPVLAVQPSVLTPGPATGPHLGGTIGGTIVGPG